ncbi:MAG TPA: hypothetical protein VMK12_11560, partial [Anaeromyxobacteraceae bacterium]|nr:hypothetical protein [Anaeromyxobacteraceae bacterium]
MTTLSTRSRFALPALAGALAVGLLARCSGKGTAPYLSMTVKPIEALPSGDPMPVTVTGTGKDGATLEGWATITADCGTLNGVDAKEGAHVWVSGGVAKADFRCSAAQQACCDGVLWLTAALGDLSAKAAVELNSCLPPFTRTRCKNPIADNAGCQATEDCGPDGRGNGLDDNCNGVIDEGCAPCIPGEVRPCFIGPPGKRNVGACTDGTQTCQSAEGGTTSWSACMSSIGPTAETCDKLDNDCNGCADDGLCCYAAIACPAPDDARIAPQEPLKDVPLRGEDFFLGKPKTWKWSITGGPCDQLFETTTGQPPSQSFTLTNGTSRDATAHFTLSGDYTVRLEVEDTDGETHQCQWVQHINGPGVRLELCWDKTGDNGSDIDLHVHQPGNTTSWFSSTADCYYATCRGTDVDWGYPASSSGAHSPRLDIDNITTLGKPENINIDDPNDGDTFRVGVHYYGNHGGDEVHPLVNVYCGGNLLATFGQAPDT